MDILFRKYIKWVLMVTLGVVLVYLAIPKYDFVLSDGKIYQCNRLSGGCHIEVRKSILPSIK